MRIKDFMDEAFNDIGKLSNSELAKGYRIDSSDDKVEVTGRVFHKAITAIKQNDLAKGDSAKGLDTLSIYSVSEYNEMRCFLGKNNSSGYALKGDELVSVFSSAGSSSKAIMTSAIEHGAKRLDCFAIRQNGKIKGQLFSLYSRYGFKIDEDMNSGKKGEPYAIVAGVSDYVDENGEVHPEDERVVIFMKR